MTRAKGENDRLKRQLVIWAGHDPMNLQQVKYFDAGRLHHAVFAGTFTGWLVRVPNPPVGNLLVVDEGFQSR